MQPTRVCAPVTNVGFASIIEAYAPFGPMTAASAETVEKVRRSIYKRRFRRLVSASCADRYLSDVWHAAPNFGLITEGIPEARRVGDGWLHCASLNAASVHAVISSAIFDGIDSQLRFCARSLLSLTCFLWGSFGAHPAEWSWGHIDELLASGDATLGSSPVGRIFPIEVYMKHVALLRRLATLSDPDRAPSFNFTIEHKPPAGDPFDRSAVIYSPLSHDTLRLFEGDLISDATCLRLGRKRRPVWLLLSAGIVVRRACMPQRRHRLHDLRRGRDGDTCVREARRHGAPAIEESVGSAHPRPFSARYRTSAARSRARRAAGVARRGEAFAGRTRRRRVYGLSPHPRRSYSAHGGRRCRRGGGMGKRLSRLGGRTVATAVCSRKCSPARMGEVESKM